MRSDRIIWMQSEALQRCARDASHFYDLETGGTLMGYWHDGASAVITSVIDAGPRAVHGHYHFEPDQQWQIDQIAKHYHASGRRETYIGDWHTHPDATSGHLSRADRKVLRRIIETPAARASNPIMLVLHGTPDEWRMTIWVAALTPRRVFWPKLDLTEASLQIYGRVN